MDEASKKILEEKKRRFLIEIDKSAEYWHVKIDEVKFWETMDHKHFPNGEIAHIHINERTICIPEQRLISMTDADIIEVANHEVSHLQYEDHDTDFQDALQHSKYGTWGPPSGLIHAGVITRKNERDVPNRKPNKTKCGECSSKKRIKQCKYCERYFCEKHLNPREVQLGFGHDSPQDTHPCFGYSRYITKKKEQDDEIYRNKLDYLCKHPSKRINQAHTSSNTHYVYDLDSNSENWNQKLPQKHIRKTERFISTHDAGHGIPAWILVFLILVILGVTVYFNMPKIYLYTAGHPTFGGIINNPLESSDISDAMFGELNYFRRSNLISYLYYDKDTYNFAVQIAKQYSFNGVTPNDTDLNSLANNYNINDLKYLFINVISKEDGLSKIKTWESNPTISVLLKTSNYSNAAIGCFRQVCALVFSNK